MEDIERILAISRMTQSCRKVVRMGISLAQKYGAKLYVMHVLHDPFGIDGWNIPNPSIQLEFQHLLQETKRELDQIIREESERGADIQELIEQGEPTEVVLEAVRKNKIDLLLMLAHEEGRLEHFLFGRSNERIVRSMPCSLLLVKQDVGSAPD
jgi:universal stress protein A